MRASNRRILDEKFNDYNFYTTESYSRIVQPGNHARVMELIKNAPDRNQSLLL